MGKTAHDKAPFQVYRTPNQALAEARALLDAVEVALTSSRIVDKVKAARLAIEAGRYRLAARLWDVASQYTTATARREYFERQARKAERAAGCA